MKHTIFEIYVYLVCFIALSCGVISLGAGVYSLVEISAPGFMLSEEWVQMHRDNESFVRSFYKSKIHEILTDEQITAQRAKNLKIVIDDERRNAIKRFIGSVIVILINIVVFIVHWRIGESMTKGAKAA
jgi:hypothetical protein